MACCRDADKRTGDCSQCQIECEIEWRARMALADTQRIIFQHFRNKADVYIDEYRVTRFAQYHRRVGTRTYYSRYAFSTVGDLLTLHGLSPLYAPATGNSVTTDYQPDNHPDIRTYPFSELKSTNCAHSFYAFAPGSSLAKNNAWPRIFVVKRSLEIGNMEMGYHDNDMHDHGQDEGPHDKPPGQSDASCGSDGAGTETMVSAATVSTIEQVLADYERTEMDRSDNNLGAAYVRKIYCLIPLNEENAAGNDKDHCRKVYGFVRLAAYSIFDEYQQIRHEIGLEYEFNDKECVTVNGALRPFSTMHCASSCATRIAVDAVRLDEILQAMARLIDGGISPYIDYVEKPMVKINVDWLADITSPSIIRMLSYTIPDDWVENEAQFVDYVLNRLKRLPYPDTEEKTDGCQRRSRYHYVLRRKLDGERCYATYDGGHNLYLSNGIRLNLQPILCRETEECSEDTESVCRQLFSVDFIYQMECVGENRYYITEVVAVRHSYSTVLSSLVHTFSPSKNFYRTTDEQVWPYGLIGTGLDNHGTSSLIDFWLTSACSRSANGYLTRDFIDTLRREQGIVPNPPHPDGDKAACCFAGYEEEDDDDHIVADLLQEDQDAIRVNGHIDQVTRPVVDDKAAKAEEEKYACAAPSSKLFTGSDNGSLCGEDAMLANEDNNDDTTRSVTTSDTDGMLKINHDTLTNHGQSDKDKGKMQSDGHSRFFLPVSARDSRRYLLALNAALSRCAAPRHHLPHETTTLRVNVPVDVNALDKCELTDYYRSYLLRLLNVLFLCGQHQRCVDYAYKHFSRDYAAQVCAAFENHRRCLSTDITLATARDGSAETIAVDGYLLYRENHHNEATIPATRDGLAATTSFCALPVPLTQSAEITAVLKIKPFHTVELLMRVNLDTIMESEKNDTMGLSSIQFLSQLRTDGSPSLFFHCCFPEAISTQKYSVAGEETAADESSNTEPYRCSLEPDFQSAKWTRYDGKTITVFVNPVLELVDGWVYEFLCYNELEFYLIAARPDKVIPDDEMKINGILFARQGSEQFFIR